MKPIPLVIRCLKRTKSSKKIRECIIEYRNNLNIPLNLKNLINWKSRKKTNICLYSIISVRLLIQNYLLKILQGISSESGDLELDDHLKKVEVWRLHIDGIRKRTVQSFLQKKSSSSHNTDTTVHTMKHTNTFSQLWEQPTKIRRTIELKSCD